MGAWVGLKHSLSYCLLLFIVYIYVVAPSMDPGPPEQAGGLNTTLTVVCGTNLVGNPIPTVVWFNAKGGTIFSEERGRYHPVIRNNRVLLLIYNFGFLDQGEWECSLETVVYNVTNVQGKVIPRTSFDEVRVAFFLSVISK